MKNKFKFIFTMILAIAIIVSSGFAYAETEGYKEPQNIISQKSKDGVDSKGINFITHDLYFDGHLFMLSITMRPNDEKYTAVEGIIGNNDKFNINGSSVEPENILGAYCELSISDADGNNIENVINGGGEHNGNAYTKTFIASIAPDKKYDEVMCNVSYGIMESPGTLTEKEPSVFYIAAPIQNKALTYEVPIDRLDKDLSYIDRIFVSQSKEITSVFIYYTPSENMPMPFSYVENDKKIDYPNTSEYAFCAYRDGDMQAIQIKDEKTHRVYSVDIKTGDCKLEK